MPQQAARKQKAARLIRRGAKPHAHMPLLLRGLRGQGVHGAARGAHAFARFPARVQHTAVFLPAAGKMCLAGGKARQAGNIPHGKPQRKAGHLARRARHAGRLPHLFVLFAGLGAVLVQHTAHAALHGARPHALGHFQRAAEAFAKYKLCHSKPSLFFSVARPARRGNAPFVFAAKRGKLDTSRRASAFGRGRVSWGR